MLGTSFLPMNLAQLYIGDLDSRVKESDLYELLKPFGEVSMIRIVKSKSNFSKAYAFVGYHHAKSASKAQRDLNGSIFFSKYIRVCRNTQDRDPKANIFIKNIPLCVSPKDLEKYFEDYGPVVSSKICVDNSGVSLRYGFVQLERREKAQEAIKHLNGNIWVDSKITVSEFLPISSRAVENKCNLYIKNFPLDYTQEIITKIFSEFGKIISVGLASIKTSGEEKPYGFVCFDNPESAAKACEALHLAKSEDFEWYVVPHITKNARKAILREEHLKRIEEWKVKNLYIRNLHKSICEKKLMDLCWEFGTVTSLKIARIEHITYDAEGEMKKEYNSKGIAFVCYALESSANTALKELQDKIVEGQKLFIVRWKPKNELTRILHIRSQNLYQKQLKNEQKHMTGMYYDSSENEKARPQRNYFGNSGMEGMKNYQPMFVVPRPFNAPPVHKMPFTAPKQPVVVENRESMGKALLSIVQGLANHNVAPKITGMMLEMGIPVLSKLMQDKKNLHSKIFEAVEVLRKAWANEPEKLKELPPETQISAVL